MVMCHALGVWKVPHTHSYKGLFSETWELDYWRTIQIRRQSRKYWNGEKVFEFGGASCSCRWGPVEPILFVIFLSALKLNTAAWKLLVILEFMIEWRWIRLYSVLFWITDFDIAGWVGLIGRYMLKNKGEDWGGGGGRLLNCNVKL
jgi:hypothetical protein